MNAYEDLDAWAFMIYMLDLVLESPHKCMAFHKEQSIKD